MKNFQRFATIHNEPYVLFVVAGMSARNVMNRIVALLYEYRNVIQQVFQLDMTRFALYEKQNVVYQTDVISSLDQVLKSSQLQSFENKEFLVSIDFGSKLLTNVIHFHVMNWVISDLEKSNIQNLYIDPRLYGSNLYNKRKSKSFLQFINLSLPMDDLDNPKRLKFISDVTLLDNKSPS
jgi:hypothetical protein